jgi:hypothetical protein
MANIALLSTKHQFNPKIDIQFMQNMCKISFLLYRFFALTFLLE